MELIPAIDLRGGRCVRLTQGDFAAETVFDDDPVAARRWAEAGARRLHIVDLDGALAGRPVHLPLVAAIARESGCAVQLGGGLRTEEAVADAFAAGVDRVVVGTRAMRDPAFLRRLAASYPGRIVGGLDFRDGRLRVAGWLEETGLGPAAAGDRLVEAGVRLAIVTDVARDGTLSGPNLELAEAVAARGPAVIVAGGFGSPDHLRLLRERRPEGVVGAILGKAIYTGRIDLSSALRAWGVQEEEGDGPC